MQEFSLANIFRLPHGACLAKLWYNFLEDPAKRLNVARCIRGVSQLMPLALMYRLDGGKISRLVPPCKQSRSGSKFIPVFGMSDPV